MEQTHPSNLSVLRRDFADIIQTDRGKDQTGKTTTRLCQRETFIFTDQSYLSITEYIAVDGTLGCFYYDWYNRDGTIRFKFHSEPHNDKKYQTATEPYHLHGNGLLDDKRLPNYGYKGLFSVLELVRIVLMIR